MDIPHFVAHSYIRFVAYSYIRFSSAEQRKGRSLERQTEKTEGFCARHKWPLAPLSYKDLGKSAFHGKNAATGALALFLEGVEDGSIGTPCALVVESLDRLTRADIIEAQTLFLRIINAGVTVCTTGDDKGGGERIYTKETIIAQPYLIFEIVIIFIRANEESEAKSRRGKSNWSSKRKKAAERPLTKMLPFWLRMERGKIVEHKDRADTVRRIFGMIADGLGRRSVAGILNREGVPGIGKKTTWDAAYINKLLQERRVLGEYQPHVKVEGKRKKHGEPVIGYYPETVPLELWYRAQAALAPRRKSRAGRPSGSVNLFNGILRDADNGEGYQQVNKGKYRYLISAACLDGRKDFIGLPQVEFEKAFLAYLAELDPKTLETNKPTDLPARIEAVEGEIANADATIKAIQARLGKSFSEALLDTMEQVEATKKEAQARLETLRSERSAGQDNSLSDTKTLVSLMEEQGADPLFRERLRSKLAQLIEKVWMRVCSDGGFHRRAYCQINFRSGGFRIMQIDMVRKGRGGKGIVVTVGTVADAHKRGIYLPTCAKPDTV